MRKYLIQIVDHEDEECLEQEIIGQTSMLRAITDFCNTSEYFCSETQGIDFGLSLIITEMRGDHE